MIHVVVQGRRVLLLQALPFTIISLLQFSQRLLRLDESLILRLLQM